MSLAFYFLILFTFSSIQTKVSTASPLVGPNTKLSPENAYPFIVSIQKKRSIDGSRSRKEYQHVCGGSLITRKHVLTAAHCFGKKLHIKRYRVMVGSNDLQNGQAYRIKTWLKYDTWRVNNKESPDFPDNDLAIAELWIPVDSKINLAKITKAPNQILRDVQVMTAGWGDISNNTTPRYMMQVNLHMISHKQCNYNILSARNFTRWFIVADNFFCTNGDPYAILNCGDSGSPLFWNENEIIGINGAVCPTSSEVSLPTEKQNLHIDVRLYSKFITSVNDNCTIENVYSISSCCPFY